jgi:hypothetical protein
MRPLRLVMILVLGAVSAGCAAFDRRPPSVDDVIHSANEQDAASVHLDLVRTMIEKEQYFAALAHLEQLENSGTEHLDAAYLKGEALRKMGRQTEAEAVYTALLGTPRTERAIMGWACSRRAPRCRRPFRT